MDFTNRKLLEGYFKYVYEKIEKKDGVDFWWIDWQQGTNTAIPGLDPLWMLNHYHTIHSQKKDGKGLIVLPLCRSGKPSLSSRIFR